MKLSKFTRAKMKLATASDKASLRKAARVLLDFGMISPKRAMFVERHSRR